MQSFRNRQLGVTLLEMMVTLAIAAILITVVAPNVQSMVNRNRIVADINDTSSALQFARFIAVDKQANAVLCPSSDFSTCSANDWNLGKIVFIDQNNNGRRDASEDLLFSTENIDTNSIMTGPNASISFTSDGATNQVVNIKLCPENRDNQLARELRVNLQGRIRLSRDSNQDGVHEAPDGRALSCV